MYILVSLKYSMFCSKGVTISFAVVCASSVAFSISDVYGLCVAKFFTLLSLDRMIATTAFSVMIFFSCRGTKSQIFLKPSAVKYMISGSCFQLWFVLVCSRFSNSRS